MKVSGRIDLPLDFTVLSNDELKFFATKKGNEWAGRVQLLREGFDHVIYFRNNPSASLFNQLYIEMSNSILVVSSSTLKRNTTMLDDKKSIIWCKPHCFVRLRYWSIFVKAVGAVQKNWRARVTQQYLESFISNLKLLAPVSEAHERAIRVKIKST